MGNSKIQAYLKRRMLTDEGWVYFCSLCGDYKLETEFYKSKQNPFGLTYKCKIHYKKDKTPIDPTTEYIKLVNVTDSDFEQTQRLLEVLGYKFGKGQLPVWRQFEIKHKLK